ncbi:MAG: Ig-like domain-containing protein [Pseudomonadota bacterium]|nr:Ig-like domain-containing protein [Pseudomonadota bacterium]
MLANTGTESNPPGGRPAPSQEGVDVLVYSSYPRIPPSGSSINVNLITYEDHTAEVEEGEQPPKIIEPFVTFSLNVVSGDAQLSHVPPQTDRNGEANFTVTHPGSGNVFVNFSGTGLYKGGFDMPIYFGGSVVAEVLTRGSVPADGQTPAEIKIIARDAFGMPIGGIGVGLSFSLGSFAVPTQAFGATDANGVFITGITNTVPQSVKVTPFAGGQDVSPLTLNFGATSSFSPPVDLSLLVKNDNVTPDGTSKATLVVVARDETGIPIPNVPVSITSNSATAVLHIGERSSPLFISGNTGEQGSFELDITNTVAEQITITAKTTSGDETEIVAEQEVIFTDEGSATGVEVGEIQLEVVNNNQLANGEETVNLRGQVFDEEGDPVVGAPVSIIVSGGSATITPNPTETDASGRFFADLTDTIVESFNAKAVIGETESNSVTVSFSAEGAPEPGEAVDVPQAIHLIASPAKQHISTADGEQLINLTATVRDSNNTPMAGIQVRISAPNAPTAIFDEGQKVTDAGGNATFTVKSNQAAAFTVSATAQAIDENGNAVGPAITDSTRVSFFAASPVVSKVAHLVVNVVNNNQPATGEDSIRVQVVARDNAQQAVANVPIVIQMAAGASAIAVPARGNTDDNGFFQTEINSTEAGEVEVIFAVEGSNVAKAANLNFVAETGAGAQPRSIDLKINNSPQPADGKSKITVEVIPRDQDNQPIAGINVLLVPDSLNIIGELEGTTNALGVFRTTLTSEIAETTTLTAIVGSLKSKPQAVTFFPVGKTATRLITSVINDQQPATGGDDDGIEINVIARDDQGINVPNVPIVVQMPQGVAATAVPFQGSTDENGVFTTTIFSTQAGRIEVTLGIKDTQIKRTETLTFVASTGAEVTKIAKIDLEVLNSPQPADGNSPISLIATPRDNEGAPIGGVNIELIIDSDLIENPSGVTNALGQYRASITSDTPLSARVTPVAWKSAQEEAKVVDRTAAQEINFIPIGASAFLEVNVINNNPPANGEDAIELRVVAKDTQGNPIANAPISVQVPPGKAAIAQPASGNTDDNGFFTTNITSTQAEEVVVTLAIKDTGVKEPVTLTFRVEEGSVRPVTVAIEDIRNSPQPADGESAITLVVVPRSADGTPIPGIDIDLVSDPQLAIESGVTNKLGQYHAQITSERAGNFNITPIASQAGEEDAQVSGQAVTITFNPVGLEVNLDVSVQGDKKPADGESIITLNVIAKDSSGRTVSGVPLAVLLPPNTAAVARPSKGETDENGFFSTEITSTVPGEIAVNIAVEGAPVAHPPVIITFIAPQEGVVPTRVELLVLNAPQPADGNSQINLVVTPVDTKGQPIAGIDVELISRSNSAELAETTGTTNALGEFRTTVTNSVAETFEIVAVADPEGARITSAPVPVVFTPVSLPIPDLLTLDVVKNNLQVGEEITLIVHANDENGLPVGNIPVVLTKMPDDVPPDVSNTAQFGEGGFRGETSEATGTFETTVVNNQPGTFKVQASLFRTDNNGKLILMPPRSNVVKVTFIPAPTDEVKEVSKLRLLASEPQLESTGFTEGVIITAITTDKDNNLVEGARVSFSSDSGEIQPVVSETQGCTAEEAGVTGPTGAACARLTTRNNPNNRMITVTATVPTTTGEVREAQITVEVVGTTLTINGPSSVVINTEETYLLTLRDSNEQGIGGQTIVVDSLLNNSFNSTSVVTNAQGLAEVIYTANNGGIDTITATQQVNQNNRETPAEDRLEISVSDDNLVITPLPSKHNLCPSLDKNEDSNNNRLLDPGEDLNENGKLDLGCQIPLGEEQRFKVHWDKAGAPQVFERLLLSSNRGTFERNNPQQSSSAVTTDQNGEATFSLFSREDAGSALLTVSSADQSGPSKAVELRFVSARPTSIVVQANPGVIGTNATGSDNEEQSEIIAVVRDANNNPVYNQRVDFSLQDITGGSLSKAFDITDEFGRARTMYVAGPNSSAIQGVKITARIPGNSDEVGLTVAKREVFVTLGSGNVVNKSDEGTLYRVPYTALVTDVNGTPVADAEVKLSIYPVEYIKGFLETPEEEGDELIIKETFVCPNEDNNPANGLLDPGEDINNNNKLDPGNVVTVDKLTLTTDSSGYAEFNVVYAIQYATWVNVRLTAQTRVAGSEESGTLTFRTVCKTPDPEPCPLQNPFGRDACDQPS